MVDYVIALLPERETINKALRTTVQGYPVLTLRELIANMLIHQDFSIKGTGPMLEIFPNRIVMTNPGTSLIPVSGLVNDPSKSRNPELAHLSRRLGLCEEAGTGWDKIITACELSQLPSPQIREITDGSPSIEVQIRTYMPFKNLSVQEKRAACYWHACLRYVDGKQLTNASLRTRFGLDTSSSSQISRLIKDCVRANLIRPFEKDAASKSMRYIPNWA